jgi:hypothetical protein
VRERQAGAWHAVVVGGSVARGERAVEVHCRGLWSGSTAGRSGCARVWGACPRAACGNYGTTGESRSDGNSVGHGPMKSSNARSFDSQVRDTPLFPATADGSVIGTTAPISGVSVRFGSSDRWRLARDRSGGRRRGHARQVTM